MTLEQQVTSLDLSRKLKELGVKQKALFYWVEWEHNSMYEDEGVESRTHLYPEQDVNRVDGSGRNFWTRMEAGKGIDEIYSAFTVAELGEILKKYDTSKHSQIFTPPTYDIVLDAWVSLGAQTSNNESDARAKMLIYLIENKLITL